MYRQPAQIQVCVQCVHDNTLPGISFDSAGVCSYCSFYDQMDRFYPLGEAGLQAVFSRMALIKKAGQGRKYDAIVGISGGRDSSYLLHMAVKEWDLRVLAVHFNDGFDNPVAGENMLKMCRQLNVPLKTITSDWREAKDLKITFLKASTPDLNQGTDVGIASSLFGAAAAEGVKYILFGQSFRTEGIKPLLWTYFDGDYLRGVQKALGTISLRPWKPDDPGFNLGIKEMIYYNLIRGIRIFAPFYHLNYVRTDTDELLMKEYGWVNPGAHYYDDLYWALINLVHRKKFNIDLRKNSYSFLVRSGQMSRETALKRLSAVYEIEDPKVIDLCIKRLGLTHKEFEGFMEIPPRTFLEYPNSYRWMRLFKYPIKCLTQTGHLPASVYFKYFQSGL